MMVEGFEHCEWRDNECEYLPDYYEEGENDQQTENISEVQTH